MIDEANPVTAGVVLGGGAGHRVGAGTNKVYLPLAGRPVITWSLLAFAATPGVGRLILVIRPEDRSAAERATGDVPVPVELVEGGVARHDSEHRALRHLEPAIRSGRVGVVAIHDGARPLVRAELISQAVRAATRYGAAIPGLPATGLVGVDPAGNATEPPAGRLVRVRTPQAFRAEPLLDAYLRAEADGFTGTDTAACVERYTGMKVRYLPGDPRNLKVTYRSDLAVAERLLGGQETPVGQD